MSIFIGIDPGSRLTGYGIIRLSGDKLEHLDAGTIHAYSQGETMPERLKRIFDGVSRIVEHYQKYTNEPMTAAIEQVFMASNPDTALKLGQARGAAICACVNAGLPVSEYAPRHIKNAVVGAGGADKTQVQYMVGILLTLQGQLQADAADALAVAITHAHVRATANRLGVATRTAWRKSR